MALAVVVAENGRGIPVVQVENGTPMTIAENGKGIPIVVVEARGIPVTINNLPEEE